MPADFKFFGRFTFPWQNRCLPYQTVRRDNMIIHLKIGLTRRKAQLYAKYGWWNV